MPPAIACTLNSMISVMPSDTITRVIGDVPRRWNGVYTPEFTSTDPSEHAATAANRTLARNCGIRTGRVISATWALTGALVIGLATEISAVFIPADYKYVIAFVALLIMLGVRPTGLLGERI